MQHPPQPPAHPNTGGRHLAARPRASAPADHRSRTPVAEARSILLGGQPVPYTLKVSARARRLRLVVRPGSGLEVVVPRGLSPAAHEPFLREKEQWILATLERVARQAVAAAPQPVVEGRRLPFAGRELQLALRIGAPAGRFRAGIAGDTLTLTLPHHDAELARTALEVWYRRQAPRIFAERLEVCNQRYSFTYGRVSIKGQKSRWGSCSRLGNLNFNWRLLLAPLPVLDYVVVHELCHLKELNHGPRFWKLVALGCPEYAIHRRWLRVHGNELVL